MLIGVRIARIVRRASFYALACINQIYNRTRAGVSSAPRCLVSSWARGSWIDGMLLSVRSRCYPQFETHDSVNLSTRSRAALPDWPISGPGVA